MIPLDLYLSRIVIFCSLDRSSRLGPLFYPFPVLTRRLKLDHTLLCPTKNGIILMKANKREIANRCCIKPTIIFHTNIVIVNNLSSKWSWISKLIHFENFKNNSYWCMFCMSLLVQRIDRSFHILSITIVTHVYAIMWKHNLVLIACPLVENKLLVPVDKSF
jgi:hypothetical protein